MPTKAKPLLNARAPGGFVEPFRLSRESRLALAALGWTDAMLAELDRRVEGARFDAGIPVPTSAQIVAALERLRQAAVQLHTELETLDWVTGHLLDEQIRRYLSDLQRSPENFRARIEDETMALGVLINAILRDAPKTKRGPRGNRLANSVAEIVRKIMVANGREPTQGGSAAVATEAVQRELGILYADTPRHSIRRAARPAAPRQ